MQTEVAPSIMIPESWVCPASATTCAFCWPATIRPPRKARR
jgi:hypothetical protein